MKIPSCFWEVSLRQKKIKQNETALSCGYHPVLGSHSSVCLFFSIFVHMNCRMGGSVDLYRDVLIYQLSAAVSQY